MLTIKKLNFEYPKSEFRLNIENLSFEPGEITAVVGGNGSGKTTLFRVLSGVYEPVNPCFYYRGEAVDSYNKMSCNVVMHNASAGLNAKLTVLQNAQLIARLYNGESKESILAIAEELGIIDLLPRYAHSLSAGQKQKSLLLRTLSATPEIIILDEPTTALDVLAIEKTLEWMLLLKEMGKTVIVSTHHLYELAVLKPNIIGLNAGRVVYNEVGENAMRTPGDAKSIIHSIINKDQDEST